MSTNGDRPRLLVLNQYYWPGVEATAYLLTELCEDLARDWDVTVVAGRVLGGRRGVVRRGGVRVVHVPSASFDRRRMALRAANYLSYLVLAGVRAAGEARPDVVLSMTDPPFVGAVAYAVARRFRAPLVVVSQDVFPETAVQVGRIRNPALVRLIRSVVDFYLRRADGVVAIGDTMRARLEQRGVRRERLSVIPNWADVRGISPLPPDNDWAREQDLVGRFVVMHFGNLGHAQDLDSLVEAATLLRDLDDLVVAIVGRGARQADLAALARRLGADSVRFIPHQPRERASQCISTARLHVVGLTRGLAGFVVPSRIYGVMAAGRPVIAAADDRSETAALVRTVGCGVVVPPGDPQTLAGAIRSAHDGKYDLDQMGRRGREYVVREASREVAAARYRALLGDLLTR